MKSSSPYDLIRLDSKISHHFDSALPYATRTRFGGRGCRGRRAVMSPIPRGPHLGVLAKTRPRHHSGPVRGVVPGTARIRETTALGGAEPIAGTVRTPVRPRGHLGSGVSGKESGRCPLARKGEGGHRGSPDEYGGVKAARSTSASSLW